MDRKISVASLYAPMARRRLVTVLVLWSVAVGVPCRGSAFWQSDWIKWLWRKVSVYSLRRVAVPVYPRS